MRHVRSKLEAELKTLERELRVDLPREIQAALAMGDLRENAEYQAALDRQNFVKARIGQIRQRLTDLGTVNLGQIPRDRVGIGSTVLLLDLDSDDEVTYELVFPEIADLEHGLISIASPIGKALVGCREGERVTIRIPVGERRFELLELRTVHDKGDGEPGS